MYKLTIIGNLSTDVTLNKRNWENERIDKTTGEVIHGQAEANVANFTVAANEGRGAYRQTQFFRIAAWRGLAEICAKYLSKGRQVYIEGVPSLNNYVDKNNNLRSVIELRADRIELLQDGKKVIATEDVVEEINEEEEPLY